MIGPNKLKGVLDLVEKAISGPPYVSTIKDPFRVLVSTMLSARTKDETTEKVSKKLFSEIKTMKELRVIAQTELEVLLYPVGFYKTKARALKRMAGILLDDYNGEVPNTIDELVKLPGVGRKTANLVVLVAFGKPGVCVDTHVHRICNRWGLVKTNTPHKTEMAIRDKIPQHLWERINALLVPFGKEICRPVSPICSSCPLIDNCSRMDVEKHR